MSISIHAETEKELRNKKILETLVEKYELPVITQDIIIKEGVIPHSHPVLTLNTRADDPLLVLETFVHEQFHWFAVNNPQYEACIEFLKKYEDLGDCNKSGTYPNSFWEHLIVNWNTRAYLQQVLNRVELEKVYSSWRAYPQTESFVEKNFNALQDELAVFDMVYKVA